MRRLFALLLVVAATVPGVALSDTFVNGYYRSDGTYVQPHYRSDPNSTVRDNFSYKGNTNPYTGKEGSNYYRNDPSSGYYNGGTGQGLGTGSDGLYTYPYGR